MVFDIVWILGSCMIMKMKIESHTDSIELLFYLLILLSDTLPDDQIAYLQGFMCSQGYKP
jgi:hypothetical protein